MASSLIQPYVDKENAPAAGARKGRIASLGARPTVGKTFANETPQTPRQVLGNISNDGSALRKGSLSQSRPLQGKPPLKKPDPLQPFKQPNLLPKKPVGLSMRKSSTTNTPKQPALQKKNTTVAPNLFRLPSKLLSDNLPPMEKMHIFEDRLDGMNGLPEEHCLSAHWTKIRPLMPPVSRNTNPAAPPFDASSYTFEDAVRPLFQDAENCATPHLNQIRPLMPPVNTPTATLEAADSPIPQDEHTPLTRIDGLLDLPPVESLDFLDINKIKLWDDEF